VAHKWLLLGIFPVVVFCINVSIWVACGGNRFDKISTKQTYRCYADLCQPFLPSGVPFLYILTLYQLSPNVPPTCADIHIQQQKRINMNNFILSSLLVGMLTGCGTYKDTINIGYDDEVVGRVASEEIINNEHIITIRSSSLDNLYYLVDEVSSTFDSCESSDILKSDLYFITIFCK
jgi:hypothetical protein